MSKPDGDGGFVVSKELAEAIDAAALGFVDKVRDMLLAEIEEMDPVVAGRCRANWQECFGERVYNEIARLVDSVGTPQIEEGEE